MVKIKDNEQMGIKMKNKLEMKTDAILHLCFIILLLHSKHAFAWAAMSPHPHDFVSHPQLFISSTCTIHSPFSFTHTDTQSFAPSLSLCLGDPSSHQIKIVSLKQNEFTTQSSYIAWTVDPDLPKLILTTSHKHPKPIQVVPGLYTPPPPSNSNLLPNTQNQF